METTKTTTTSATPTTAAAALAVHLNAGARERYRLFKDDVDRRVAIALIAGLLGQRRPLAWALLDTHLHVLAAEIAGEVPAADLVARAMMRYTRAFNERHGYEGTLLRGPVHATPKTSAFEVARTISYIHDNPGLEPRYVPLFTSAREYAGLVVEPIGDPVAGRALAGPNTDWIADTVALADLAPACAPTYPPQEIVAAAAQAYRLTSADLAGRERDGRLSRARALAVSLAKLEGYSQKQIGPALGRSQAQISRLVEHVVPPAAIQAARTILRDPALRRAVAGAAA